ncbi:MAG: EAL domain-containing protein [Gammaproteobacteria bacterium]|nr:EAL domain-containing protein [Gammaproteobacteria bacterium]
MEILIVDNSKLYSQILESNIEPDGNTIHYYKSPVEALETVSNINYDYICVSLALEQMDGIEFTRQIRLLNDYAHTPVILFASKKDEGIIDNAFKSGITDIFFKEDDVQEFIAHIIRFSQRKKKINAKVLLVEDSLSQQQMMQSILEDYGLTVTSFENGSDAFDAFLQTEFDLVITDIILEGHVSGVKLVNMIRRLNSEKGDVPILAMTAFDNLSRRIDLFSRGISDYVQKPIVEEEFLSRVNNLINNRRLLKLLMEQRKAVELASDEELRVMACAFESSDAILISDAYGHIIRTNQSFLNISGYASEEVVNKNIWSFVFIPEYENFKHLDEKIKSIKQDIIQSGKAWESNGRNKRKNGELYDINLKIGITRNYEQEIRHYVVVFSDCSAQIEAEEQLIKKEYYDSLTGLANRKRLMKDLESEFIALEPTNKFGILFFINLVRFKSVNESLGTHIGDQLLIEVSKRLSEAVCEQQVTVSRIGGQKFVILMSNISSKEDERISKAEFFANKIKKTVCKNYVIEEHSIHLSIHIGISLFPSGQNSIHDVLKQAELANYSAGLDHKDIFFFTQSLQDKINQTAFIEQNLEHALDKNELSLYFQPQYDHESKLIGAEALLRWRHDNFSIPPDLFIPVAEKTLQINKIGRWVLLKAFETVNEWLLSKQISPSFKMAINVSPVQYLNDDFVLDIENLFQQFPEASNLIQFEITETIFAEKIDQVIVKMKKLKTLGFEISIDDFGTGYSSLSYLTKLPISFLKIDKSFVRDINIDKNNEMIVETIISMAHHMGMKVIAEGVETQRQFIFLRNKNCEFFQGYLFSKPLTIKQFEILLRQNQTNLLVKS